MATLKDIAEKCGTSTATVSYVLSGRGEEKRISAEMQQLIAKTAEDLEYTRKSRIGSPISKRVIVYFPLLYLNMLLSTFLDGMTTAVNLESSNIDVVLRPYEQNKLHLQHELWTPAKNCAALVVSPGGADLANLTETPTAIPLILLNRTLPGYSSVCTDQLEAGQLAAKLAIKKGGDDILLVTTSSLFGVSWRTNAFVDFCSKNGISLAKSTYYADTSMRSGYELGKKLVKDKLLKKVIFCVYDMTALGLSAALTDSGVKVGRDVLILTTNSSNAELFEFASPPVTVIDMRFKDVCQMAMRLALDIAAGRASYPQDVSIHPVAVYRQSCPF